LDSEAKLRVALFREVSPKLVAAEQLIEARAKEHRTLEQEVSRVNGVVGGSVQDIIALKDSLLQESNARRFQEETTLDLLRKLRDECRGDIQARIAQYEEQWRGHLAELDVERSDRQQACAALKDKIAALEKHVLPHAEEVPVLRNRLWEVESSVAAKFKESYQLSEQEIADRVSAQHKLERRIADLSAFVEKEHSARAAQAEESEQSLQSFKVKVTGMVVEQADLSRQAREEMQSSLKGQVERETTMREVQTATLLDHCNENRSAIEARADKADAALRALEQRCRDDLATEVQNIQAVHSQHADAWSRSLREQGDFLQAKIVEERNAREAQCSRMESFD